MTTTAALPGDGWALISWSESTLTGVPRNYRSVGQTRLLDNPLLREQLKPEHVKPRLLGHFGTVPGLNLV